MKYNTAAAILLALSAHYVTGAPTTPAGEILAQAIKDMGGSRPPDYTPEASNGCDPSQARCVPAVNGHSSAAGAPTCNQAEDCISYCHSILGDGDVGSTCAANFDYPGSGDYLESICTCYDSTYLVDVTTDALVAIGEATCFVVNEAMALTPKVLNAIGTISKVKQVKWAGKIVKIGNHLLAHGSKMGKCDDLGCPGHEFTMLDPNDLENSLGALNVC
jgi:hypothetical protein